MNLEQAVGSMEATGPSTSLRAGDPGQYPHPQICMREINRFANFNHNYENKPFDLWAPSSIHANAFYPYIGNIFRGYNENFFKYHRSMLERKFSNNFIMQCTPSNSASSSGESGKIKDKQDLVGSENDQESTEHSSSTEAQQNLVESELQIKNLTSKNTNPAVAKDDSYWERRRRNNEAAKRSRDSRRAKEDEIAIRAAYLEQENLRLKFELAKIRNETSKLTCLLYNTDQDLMSS